MTRKGMRLRSFSYKSTNISGRRIRSNSPSIRSEEISDDGRYEPERLSEAEIHYSSQRSVKAERPGMQRHSRSLRGNRPQSPDNGAEY